MAFSLLAVASVHAVPPAVAQGDGGERPLSAKTTGDWSVQVVTDDLSYPWDIDRVGNLLMITEAAGNIVRLRAGA